MVVVVMMMIPYDNDGITDYDDDHDGGQFAFYTQ